MLRLEDKSNDNWRIGVIRWMQSLSDNGVKIGLETFRGTVKVIEVVDAHQTSERLQGFNFALQLTEETVNETIKTVITPPNAVNKGDTLVIQKSGKHQNIVFENRLEQTISFARFSYRETPTMPSGE